MIHMTWEAVAAAVGAESEPQAGRLKVRRVTTDSRDVRPGDLFIAISGDRFDGHRFMPEAVSKGAVACVCSRSWFDAHGADRTDRAAPLLVVEDTVAALGRLAAHYRRRVMDAATVVVAVTGSNGKTTTKGMLDHVLSGSLRGRAAPKSFNNRIGVPLTLLSAEAGDRYLIVEIGTNAPGEVVSLASMASPDVGIITSIGEAHLEGLSSIDGVAAEKTSLLDHVRPRGFAVVNIDRPEIVPHLARSGGRRLVTIGHGEDAGLRVNYAGGDLHGARFELYLPTVLSKEGVRERLCVEVSMPGLHHGANVAAAVAVARWLDVATEQIVERLRAYRPPEGRARLLEFLNLTVVDDAYNANPASMAAAIETAGRVAKGRCVFVMGEMLELGSHSALLHRRAVKAVFAAGMDVLVAVGPAVVKAVREARPVDAITRVVECESAAEVSDKLMAVVVSGDAVWIKGSRAVGLDRVVRELEGRFNRCEPRASARAELRGGYDAGGLKSAPRTSAEALPR